MLGNGFAAMVQEARSWVMDCVENWEDVLVATDTQVVNYVNRHYEGGWEQFRLDMTE